MIWIRGWLTVKSHMRCYCFSIKYYLLTKKHVNCNKKNCVKRNKFQVIFSFDMKQSVDFVLFLHFLFFKCCWLNKYLRLYMPISLEEMHNNWNSISLHLNSFWSPLFKNVDLYTSWFRKLAYSIALLLILNCRKSLKSAFFKRPCCAACYQSMATSNFT